MKQRNKKTVYVVKGIALDQQTIDRQRPQIEDYVREDLKKKFRKTSVSWEVNKDKTLDFVIEFYG
jgi:hypothetical protein